ncbi:hypothetical protein [Allokutzneria albata]|uniref:Uncharacterized protein n=1 Tax=Allokutzneria albata TaxID=211114 RepID=A0A1G9SHW8_ALLAB|nr:hypothetical protein [Allokutzneria albata]SDM34375.1 hypothetical protein SAMN04489726_1145 [Allokutzneria albata]
MQDAAVWTLLPLVAVAAAAGTGALMEVRPGGRAPRPEPASRRGAPPVVYANPITCGRDRREHRVSDAAFHQGQGIGNYAALCGHVVAPLPMAEPSGPPCHECLSASRVAVTGMRRP